MSRSLIVGAFAAIVLMAAPNTTPIDTSAQKPLWDELGLKSAEKMDFGPYTLNAWRFQDSTGALAGLDELQSANPKAKPVQSGNYVLECTGKCPANLAQMAQKLPNFRNQPLPVLRTYIPSKGLIPGSARYVLGPTGLAEASPQIPASAVAFQFGPELALGKYRIPKSKDEMLLAVLEYPTPQMARQQVSEFQKIPSAVVKRSGPVIGLVLGAPEPQLANGLLKQTQYEALMSWDEPPPLIIKPQTAAQIVLGGMELAGIVVVFCVLSGLGYGGYRLLRAKFGTEVAGEPMIVLHLGDK